MKRWKIQFELRTAKVAFLSMKKILDKAQDTK
jgi:hypothetical protein